MFMLNISGTQKEEAQASEGHLHRWRSAAEAEGEMVLAQQGNACLSYFLLSSSSQLSTVLWETQPHDSFEANNSEVF